MANNIIFHQITNNSSTTLVTERSWISYANIIRVHQKNTKKRLTADKAG